MISPPGTTEEVFDEALAGYGLMARECRLIRTNLAPSGHKLCRGFLP